jgi:Rieske Fe-S protein
MTVGIFDKMFDFFRGPRLEPQEQAELGEERLRRLEKTAEEKELEIERIRSPYIPVARLSDLNATTGHYFIDYQMRPSLAFLTAAGVPHLLSAKCTHLGCTVGSQVDGEGRILCPCHVSHFTIATGQPNSGAPAKAPLPVLGWVVMNNAGEIVARRPPGPDSKVDGTIDPAQAHNLVVHIAREYREEEMA